MRCALELVATATIIAEENARIEEIRRLKEQEEKRIRTIQLCEELGVKLEIMAERGTLPTISFYCDSYGRRLMETYNDYADKRLSYRVIGESINFQTLAEWFAQYCFETTVSDFGYYRYGCGWCCGYVIKISPKPECLS